MVHENNSHLFKEAALGESLMDRLSVEGTVKECAIKENTHGLLH